MGTIEWTEVKTPPRLRSGVQMVTINTVRPYTNNKGNQCVELLFVNDTGGKLPVRFSVEREHQIYCENFLKQFFAMTYADLVRHGGWDSLVGKELLVSVDYHEGEQPRMEPMP